MGTLLAWAFWIVLAAVLLAGFLTQLRHDADADSLRRADRQRAALRREFGRRR